MDGILRALVIYAFLMVMFRVLGKRSLGQVTTFDFVLLLLIGEATQQALLGDDFSLVNALTVIGTLALLDVGLSFWQARSSKVDRMIEGLPLVLIDNGELLEDRMKQSKVSEREIRESARELHGLERISQIKYAVLERSGTISIIPKESS